MASRAENLSHRCKSVPTGTLSAKIFQGLKTRSTYIGFQNEGGKEQTNGLATWLLEVKPDNWWWPPQQLLLGRILPRTFLPIAHFGEEKPPDQKIHRQNLKTILFCTS